MISTSFVEYLNAGTQCAKTGKTGKIPRPGRPAYPVQSLMFIFCQCVSNHKSKLIQLDFTQDSHPKTERLESRIYRLRCRKNLIF